MTDEQLCEDCRRGYHAPFERFQRVATWPDGPAFLNTCTICGALWYETLRSARRVTKTEARTLFPEVQP
jgi:hypothetical protein